MEIKKMEIELTYNSLINKAIRKLGSSSGNFTVKVFEEKENLANTFLKLLDDTVLVEAITTNFIAVDCNAITVLGQTVAKASGRDSGAFVPTSVMLMDGAFFSGGSRKNWETRAEKDTKIQFKIPRYIFEKYATDEENWNIKLADVDNQRICDIL